MKFQQIKMICGYVCAAMIILGVILAVIVIWANVSNEYAWKAWATLGVLFAASLGVGLLADFASKKIGEDEKRS